MAGVAGAVIGLTTGAQANIAGAQALVDGTTSARGCTTNFIGFGLDVTSEEENPDDFSATDDTVTLAITGGDDYEPVYTPVAGTDPARSTLSWAVPTP